MALCQGLTETLGTNPSMVDFLSYPTVCDFQFYAKILAGIFFIVAVNLYIADRNRLAKADFMSCLGVAAIATMSLALVGTAIGFIQRFIFIEILVAGIVIIAIWFFKK